MLTPFKKIQTERLLGQVQSNVESSLNSILRSQIIDGILLTDIFLDSTKMDGNRINHLLGRKPVGYFVVNQNSNSTVWQADTQNLLLDKIIYLKCSADVIVSLWIF